MIPKIRNIIIFLAIASVFALVYIFFIKPAPEEENLVSTSNASLPSIDDQGDGPDVAASLMAKDFLTLLLGVKNIKLNDAIFSDLAFTSLQDSSVPLVQDGTEGRSNPFAPFGSDVVNLVVTPENPSSSSNPPTNP